MNLKESDVFIFKEPIDVELLLLEYRKHVKFCLKQSFYVGLPFSCDQDLVFKFKQLFAEFEKDGQIFFYFSFKPHQSIRSIIDESSSKPR